jgi:Transglycosylase SLT domain
MRKKHLINIFLTLFTVFFFLSPATARADLSPDQITSIDEGSYYFNTEVCGAGSTPPQLGTLPKVIPEPYNGAFTSGGQKFNVSPALVAAIFTEENLTGSHPADLPTYWSEFAAGTLGQTQGSYGKHQPAGNPNTGWPHSSAGAEGPFQFLPSTWAEYGVDNSGDGRADINNILDASAGAAHLLAANGATNNKPVADWRGAIYSYNHADWYVNAVMTYYNYYTTGNTSPATPSIYTPLANPCAVSTTGPSDCKNPFRDIQAAHDLRPSRIDMGVDYAGGNSSQNVYAICSGTIENLVNAGWDFGGYDAFISIKIDSGPAAGLYSYMAEDCVPKPGLVPGKTHVTSDTPICSMSNPGGSGIETGWAAAPGNGETEAALHGQYAHDGNITAYGVNYNDLLKKLGAPSGTGNTSNPVGSLPPNWPKWQ